MKHLRDQLEVELNKRINHEKLCEDMSLLKIEQNQLNDLEWNGKHLPYATQKNNQQNVAEQNEDVLKMFISHSGIHKDKIIIKYISLFYLFKYNFNYVPFREKPEELLIKPSDLIDEESIIKDKQQDNELIEFPENVERYAKNLCGRIDTQSSTDKKQILLNKPAKSNKYSAIKAEVISLKESVMLQYKHENKLKVNILSFITI